MPATTDGHASDSPDRLRQGAAYPTGANMTKPASTPWATYLGSAIGRYTESEGGDSPGTQAARTNLFDVYDEWCQAGRPIRDLPDGTRCDPPPHSGGGAAPSQVTIALLHRRQLGLPAGMSPQQRRVLDAEGVTYIGTDAKGRPVVEAPPWWRPNALPAWALLRSGDPADVVQPVRLVQREQVELGELVAPVNQPGVGRDSAVSADQVHVIDQPQAEKDDRWSVACSCGWKTCGLQAHVDRSVARHRARVAG